MLDRLNWVDALAVMQDVKSVGKWLNRDAVDDKSFDNIFYVRPIIIGKTKTIKLITMMMMMMMMMMTH